jgi:VCBS repeat-containing protein
MEPRILLSADLFGIDAATTDLPDDSLDPGDVTDPVWPAAEVVSTDPAGNESVAPTARHEILFVDTSIDDYQTLLSDILQGREAFSAIHLIDGSQVGIDQGGIKQIGRLLASASDVDAVHILSHGAPGELRIGADVITSDNIDRHDADLQAWGRALAVGADILLYGCDLAAGDEGKALIAAIADATGADVAASVDVTGNAAAGGDWELEHRDGMVGTAAFLPTTYPAWQGTLAITPSTVILNPVADTWLDEVNQDDSYGTDATLVMGSNATTPSVAGDHRVLLRFDLSAIPTGATITDATLRVFLEEYNDVAGGIFATSDVEVDAYLVYESWDEASATWNQTDGSNPWAAVPGGSGLIVGSGWDETNPPGYNYNMVINEYREITGLATVVQDWVDGTTSNYGLALNGYRGAETLGAAVPTLTFSSTESGGFLPELVVSYSLPADYYLDRFDTASSYLGDDGTLSWSNAWQEVGEAEGPGGGEVLVADGFAGDGGGNTELSIRADRGAWREADLDGATTATLSFDYARVDLEADDHLVVYAQTGGDTGGVGVPGAPGAWDEIARFSGPADDAAYLTASIDLGAYLASDTRVLFVAEGATQGNDYIYVDNVRIDVTGFTANAPPTFTAFGDAVASGMEDTEVEITYAELTARGDAADGDGSVDSFVVKTLSSGTLKIGTSAGAATAWAVGSNDTIDANRNAYWTPDTDANGTLDAFGVVAKDNDGSESDGSVTAQVAVSAVNDAPVATADAQGTGENAVLNASVPAASDVDGVVVSYALATDVGVGNGSLTFNADGSYSFDPGTDFDDLAAGAIRAVSFTYTATDNDGAVSASATVTITVTGTNDAPVATADAQGTGENAVLNASVPAASDVDGDVVSYALATDVGAGNGSLIFDADGSYSFDPGTDFDDLAAGAIRAVSFTYTATDNDGAVSASATVTITVTGTNDAPVATADAQGTGENAVLNASVPAASDVDGDVVSYALATDVGAGNGSLIFDADGSYRFDPGMDFDDLAAGAIRAVSFTYTATDNDGAVSAPATVTITVTGTNDAPVATADAQGTGENAVLNASVPAASDVDGDVVSYALATDVGAGNGSLIFDADGSYRFDPGMDFDDLAAGAIRAVSFTYTATDNDGAVSAPATVTITVTGTNDAPVATADAQGTGENAVLNASVPAASDVDGDVVSYALATDVGAGNGSLIFDADGSYRFDPGMDFDDLAAGAIRAVSFTYTATDNDGAVSAPATVTITVTGANDVPVASADAQGTGENAVLNASVPVASDPDGTIVSYALATDVGMGNGSLTFNPDGSYRFDPGTDFDDLAAGAIRAVSFTYTATDNDGAVSAPATVTITVTGANDVPVASADAQGTGENAVLNASVPAASDPDGTIVSYALATDVGVGNGSLTFNADGSYRFDPGSDFDDLADGATRAVSFTYTATDNDGAVSAPATVTITVTGTNDAPVASADTQGTGENVVLNASVPVASDVDGDVASYALATDVGAGNGSLIFDADGSYSFDPGMDFDDLAAGAIRAVSFTYTATDNDGAVSAPATVTITVTGANDAPTVTGLTGNGSFIEGGPPEALPGIVVQDPDAGDIITASLVLGDPAAGWLTTTGGATFDAASGLWVMHGKVAEVNTALAGVSFVPARDYDQDVVITVQVDDGDEDGSGPLRGTITLAAIPHNDAPYLATNGLVLEPGARLILTPAMLSVADADDAKVLQIAVSDVRGGQFEFVSAPGVAIHAFTPTHIADGQVVFVDDGNRSPPAFLVSVSDGVTSSEPVAGQVTLILRQAEPVAIDMPEVPTEAAVPPITAVMPPDADDGPRAERIPADDTSQDAASDQAPSPTDQAPVDIVIEPRFDGDAGADPITDRGNDRSSASGGSLGSVARLLRDMLAERADTVVAAVSPPDGDLNEGIRVQVHTLLATESFRDGLDRVRDEVTRMTQTQQTTVGASVAVGTSLSVGYVAWLVRGGVLLSTALSTLPAWQFVDPLPVLAKARDGQSDDADDQSLQGIIEDSEKKRSVETVGAPSSRSAMDTADTEAET